MQGITIEAMALLAHPSSLGIPGADSGEGHGYEALVHGGIVVCDVNHGVNGAPEVDLVVTRGKGFPVGQVGFPEETDDASFLRRPGYSAGLEQVGRCIVVYFLVM